MDILDIARYFDPIDRIEGAISTFINADWKRAWKKSGPLGIASEILACLTAHNSPTIRVSRESSWRGVDVERLLAHYGIRVWDRGASGEELYFCVKRRQVKWAEYVLNRAGVVLTSKAYEPRNAEWAEQHNGAAIPAWGNKN